jgi:excisionase family DNA binding protein
MEGLVLVKVSELNAILEEIKLLRQEFDAFRKNEDELQCYSIQEAAKLLSLHYCTVRELVLRNKLHSKNAGTNKKGRYVIPAWAIREYLQRKNERIKLSR